MFQFISFSKCLFYNSFLCDKRYSKQVSSNNAFRKKNLNNKNASYLRYIKCQQWKSKLKKVHALFCCFGNNFILIENIVT